METQELKSIVEALIFAADEPLSEARIRETLELENGFDFGILIDTLNQEYQNSGRVFTIRKIAGGYQIVTQQSYASWIKKLYLGRQKNRLSHAALETLALIAFKQPISRVDIGQIRGVNSDGVIGTLLERKLVTISGRSEAVGRPLLYSTTPEFLKYFGINDITDLPKPREIEELFSKEGMPEELLQALSQTDAQLSLPINADGETAAPDETENKDKISGVDINEKVVTQLEATDDRATVPLTAPAFAPEGENEIAWISLNSAVDHAVAEATSNEIAIEDLAEKVNELPTFAGVAEVVLEQTEEQATADEVAIEVLAETANDLPTFAGVTEVASGQATEQPATNEFALEALAETANELSTFASVAEVVSDALVVEEKRDAAAEIETKLAALEAMTEEMTADFVRTDAVTGDREEVAESFVAGVDEVVAMVAESPAAEVQVIEAYDVGLTDIESPPAPPSAATAEVDAWMAEELTQEEIVEPDFMKKSGDFFLEEERRPAVDLIELTEAEPIVVSNAELLSAADEVVLSFGDAAADENLELVAIDAAPAVSTHKELITVDVSSVMPELAATTQSWRDDEIATVSLPAAAEIVSVPVFEKEQEFVAAPVIAVHADESTALADLKSARIAPAPLDSDYTPDGEIAVAPSARNEMASLENDDNHSATLRARVVGWFKRTFNKLLALIGATGESE